MAAWSFLPNTAANIAHNMSQSLGAQSTQAIGDMSGTHAPGPAPETAPVQTQVQKWAAQTGSPGAADVLSHVVGDNGGIKSAPIALGTLTGAPAKPGQAQSGIGGLPGIFGSAMSMATHVPLVGPVMRGIGRAYTDVISHPLSAAMYMSQKANYDMMHGKNPINDFVSKSAWVDSWQHSNTISPGQELQVGINNSPIQQLFGQHSKYVDISNPEAVQAHFDKTHVGANLQSGIFDMGLGFLVSKGSAKVGKVPATLRDKPMVNNTSIEQVMTSKGMDRLKTQIGQINERGGGAIEIQNLKAVKASPMKNQIAAAMSGANPEQLDLLMRVGLGDTAAVDQLAQISAASANRAAQLLAPTDMLERFHLGAEDPAFDGWLKSVSDLKAKAADAAVSPEQAQHWADFRGVLTNRTTGDLLGGRVAQAKTSLQTASRPRSFNPFAADESTLDHPNTLIESHRANWYDFPVRVYQSLTDKQSMGLINFTDGSAADSIRSWLNKSSTLTPEYKQSVFNRVAGASQGDLQKIWDDVEQHEVPQQLADRYGIDVEKLKDIVVTSRHLSNKFAEDVKAKAYGVKRDMTTGEDHAVIPSHDDEVITHPVFETQLQDGAYPQLNLRHLETILSHLDETGKLKTVMRMAGPEIQNVLQNIYGIWKPLTLLTMHRAYNHIGDDYLRSVAKLGAMSMAKDMGEGAGNFLKNRAKKFTQAKYVGNLQGEFEKAVDNAEAAQEGLKVQYRDQRARMASGEQIDVSALIREQDLEAAQSAVDIAKADHANAVTNADSIIQPKHRLGTGESYIKGTRVKAIDAFGGPNADYLRRQTSSGFSFQNLMVDASDREYAGLLGDMQKTGNHIPIYPTMENIPAAQSLAAHAKAWTAFVNNHMRQSPLARVFMKPGATLQNGLDFLKTPAGKAHLQALGNADAEGVANDVFALVHQALPDDVMRGRALNKPVKVKDLETWMPNPSLRPVVPGEEGLLAFGKHPGQNRLQKVTTKILKVTGSLPDDIMVRHPVYNSFYKSHRDNLFLNAAEQRGISMENLMLMPDEINALQKSAGMLARKDMQDMVYDTTRFNDAGSTLRFISPFFNAWYNAMSSWGKLFKDNPALLVDVQRAKHGIWNNPYVVDNSTGQRSNDDTPMKDMVFVGHMPLPLSRMLGMSDDARAIPISITTLVSPTYADAVGNPGFGPVVQIPANHIAKEHPSFATSDAFEAISGGRITKNDFQSFLPSAATNLLALGGLSGISGTGDQDRAKAAWAIYQNQQYDYLSGKRSSPPNWSDIQKQATYTTAIDLFLNRLMPLGFKPATNQQFFVDQYRTLMDADPTTAKQKFAETYGEAAMVFTQSLDKNVGGVAPTAGAIETYKKHQKLVKDDPGLASVIIGPDGSGTYSAAALQWEYANGLRKQMSPEDAAKQANVDRGYSELDRITAYEQAELQRRGLTSTNQKEAKDLKAARAAWIAQKGDPENPNYNPDFYTAYGSYNQNAYSVRIQSLETIAAEPSLLHNVLRSDIKSLNKYFQIRDQVRAYLEGRTSTSLSAKSNADVSAWFDYQIGVLKQDDTKFTPIWERYLKNDNLKEPAKELPEKFPLSGNVNKPEGEFAK